MSTWIQKTKNYFVKEKENKTQLRKRNVMKITGQKKSNFNRLKNLIIFHRSNGARRLTLQISYVCIDVRIELFFILWEIDDRPWFRLKFDLLFNGEIMH